MIGSVFFNDLINLFTKLNNFDLFIINIDQFTK